MIEAEDFDVIIVGGSYAGLSAAMTLGRSLRKTLIIDGGKPCNAPTPFSHNFLTQDGKKPSEIASIGKEQVLKYDSVKFHDGFATSGAKTDSGFQIETLSGQKFNAKKVILATGIKDKLPNIQGFKDCWGITIVHCPYCHGFEHRNQKTAILANSDKAIHLASLVHNLTKDLTILTLGPHDFDLEQAEKLKRNGIEIVETKVSEIVHQNGHVQNVVFEDLTKTSFQVIYASVPFSQHSNLPFELDCELTEHGHIKVDNMQKTSVEGVFACGDNTTMMRSVANAVNSGNIAGAIVNKELVDAQF